MQKLKCLCEYSHDYDGFVYVENECKCSLCQGDGKYFLCCESKESRDYEEYLSDYTKTPLTEEDLSLCVKNLCLKYCSSEWARTYNIHNDKERFPDETPVSDILK